MRCDSLQLLPVLGGDINRRFLSSICSICLTRQKEQGTENASSLPKPAGQAKAKGLGGAKPSHENAMKYFVNANLWSKDDDIEMFYFSSFDESWKVGSEGDVGAYWGIWDSNMENLNIE